MTLIDVRSPKEFQQGHIPGAHNLPLFSDEERARVGTCYKQEGQKAALHLGLSFAGPKLSHFVTTASNHKSPLQIYCARGGMRSQAMCWLFSFAQIDTTRLEGGYKKWRQTALSLFSQPWNLRILGGMTGGKKTHLLHELRKKGTAIIDLEELAAHRGSSFGASPERPQPTQEQFENLLALQLSKQQLHLPLYLEDESRFIGSCKIPDPFFSQMRKAPLFLVERTREERVRFLLEEYGSLSQERLIDAFMRLQKRLGRERVEAAKALIQNNELEKACLIALDYYDKCYQWGLSKREGPIELFAQELL